MRNIAFLCVVVFCCLQTNAQNSAFNSGLVISKALQLHQEQKYEQAIALYKSIPRNDTNYVRSLYQMTLSYVQDSNYTAALITVDKALEKKSIYELELLIAKGTILDDQGDSKAAITCYDDALKKYPNAQTLLLNKSITLIRLGNIAEAEKMLQDLAIKNPYYASVHMRLASCALRNGRIIPAMMSLFTYLVLHPSGIHKNACINSLSSISKNTDDIAELIQKRSGDDPLFQQAEQIVLSKVALDKGYKLQSSLDDPIVRQLQVLMEVIQYKPATNDFWMEYYTPLFKQIFSDKKLHPLVNQAFSSVNIESIQKYTKNNNKEIRSALDGVIFYLNNIRSTRTLSFEARKGANKIYHFNNNDEYIGNGNLSQKGQPIGDWTFYHANGNLKSAGTFKENGEKTGRWIFYFDNQLVNGVEYWRDGIQTGKDSIFFINGALSTVSSFVDGKMSGEKITYYSRGNIKSRSNFENDKLNGLSIEYYNNGSKQLEATFVNGELNGPYQSYYKNEKLQFATHYKNGKLDGSYKTYYENGTLSGTFTYVNGQLNDKGIEYHENGTVKESRNYKADKLEGVYEEYNEEGTLITSVPYRSDKAEGLGRYYDSDKKLFSTFEFDNGILKKAVYFDKTGKEINSSIRKKGQLELTSFNPDGTKNSLGVYDDAGRKIGKSYFYYASGKHKEINDFDKGQLQGFNTGFYPDGTISYKISYKDGAKNGLATYYYSNGQVRTTGNYLNGSRDGEWMEYNEKGLLSSKYNYKEDQLEGYNETYRANGKIDYEEFYKDGWLSSVTTFDTAGKVLLTSSFENGNGMYKGVFPGGNKRFECSFKNGELEGKYASYFFDGSPRFTKTYKGGLIHGMLTEYYYGGSKASEGIYDHDKLNGTWKYFYKDGKLQKEQTYLMDERYGKVKVYYSSGALEREIDYRNNEIHGEMKRYSEDGQLMGISFYKEGQLTGYTYFDKNKNLLPTIALVGGTGKMQTFYPGGGKALEIEYADGFVNGDFKQYHPNGQLMYHATDNYGETNGTLSEFYADGKPKLTYSYTMDVQDGPFKEYHTNGKLKEEGSYFNGSENGAFKYYDLTGKLTAHHIYYYGTLINVIK